MILTARVFPIHRFSFKGNLVDPQVRASNDIMLLPSSLVISSEMGAD
jgi:hypothetical protein